MMSLTFGLFTQVSGSGPLGPLVIINGLCMAETACADTHSGEGMTSELKSYF